MVVSFRNEPKGHSQEECRHPQAHNAFISEHEFQSIEVISEPALFVHSGRHLEAICEIRGKYREHVMSKSFAYPVSIRNQPFLNRINLCMLRRWRNIHTTPPMHPTRICRGKKPINDPRRNFPRVKNAVPVRIAEKENAARVVAMTAFGSSSPIMSTICDDIMLKNG